MKTLVRQTLAVSVLSTMVMGSAFAAPSETPPAFIKKVADHLIARLKADHAKLQNNPALVKSMCVKIWTHISIRNPLPVS